MTKTLPSRAYVVFPPMPQATVVSKLLRPRRLRPGVHEHEVAGAVCALCLARVEGGLAEEGGLLVTEVTSYGDARAEELGVGVPDDPARRAWLG